MSPCRTFRECNSSFGRRMQKFLILTIFLQITQISPIILEYFQKMILLFPIAFFFFFKERFRHLLCAVTEAEKLFSLLLLPCGYCRYYPNAPTELQKLMPFVSPFLNCAWSETQSYKKVNIVDIKKQFAFNSANVSLPEGTRFRVEKKSLF